MRKFIEITDVTGQAGASAAGTAIFTLPKGYRYHRLLISLVSVTSQAIAVGYPVASCDIRFKYNGNIQRIGNHVEINAANALNNPPSATLGTAAATPYSLFNDTNPGPAILQYPFTEDWRKQYRAAESFAFDHLPGDAPATLEVDYGSVSTAPVVLLRAEVEDMRDVIDMAQAGLTQLNRVDIGGGRSLPTLVKHYRTTRVVSGTTYDLTDLERKDRVSLIRLYDPTGAYISAVEIQKDSETIFKRTAIENASELRWMGMNPTAISAGSTIFDIVPDASDAPRDAWDFRNARSLLLRTTHSASASGTMKIIQHRFGPVD
jgi:hypothetical protein